MRTYCVKQKKQTECVPGSERIKTTSNGRHMIVCKCAECGVTKTQFTKSRQTGGAVNSDFSCGYNLKGKRAGTMEECFKKGQIRQWGVKNIDDVTLDALIADRMLERNKKRRKPPKPSMSVEKKRQYIDEIVSDIKKRNIEETAKKRD